MHPVSVGLNVIILVNLPAVFQATLDHIGLCQVSVLIIYVLCAFYLLLVYAVLWENPFLPLVFGVDCQRAGLMS